MTWMRDAGTAGSDAEGPSEQDVALARAALLDITTAGTVGDLVGFVIGEDGVLTLYFDTTMAGYPGWRWTVSIAHVGDAEASVLETELTPGDGALLSPDWVPWSERLADYQEAQAELAAQAAADDDDDDDDHDDDDDDDDDDGDDDNGFDALDGIDIDALDDSDLTAVDHHEAEESEDEADDAGPQPPVKARRNQRAKKQQQPDEDE